VVKRESDWRSAGNTKPLKLHYDDAAAQPPAQLFYSVYDSDGFGAPHSVAKFYEDYPR
jgi:hypothetical protein